jgi:FkbM family methyltransferase
LNLINLFLQKFRIPIVRRTTFKTLWETNFFHSIVRWNSPEITQLKLREFVLSEIEKSHSQLQQDLVAQFIFAHNPKSTQGYFVEFGATDGIGLSNSFILEKYYGWTGILAEPSRRYKEPLKSNRNCHIDFRCVYSIGGQEIEFTEMEIGEHSSIEGYSRTSMEESGDLVKDSYLVKTVTLGQLLKTNQAPRFIDFLSIDTEGTEYFILKDFNFDEYTFGFIAVELSQNIREIDELLTNNGYVKVLSNLSRWDGWYVPRENSALLA